MPRSNSTQDSLIVVGGTYVERSHFPAADNIYGSGLRAAAAISNRNIHVDYHTFISNERDTDLRATAAIFGIAVHASAYPETFVFEYLHSLAPPTVDPLRIPEPPPPLEISGTRVLCFGMMEGNPVINGERVVYDPQCPNDPRRFGANGSTAQELAIVCNESEARTLAGVEDIHEARLALFGGDEVNVVVIKRGTRGALVLTQGKSTAIPAYRSRATSLIGSGDVFSAVFAHHWLVLKDDAVTAAEAASKSTAYYCATQVLPIPCPLPGSFELMPAVELTQRKIYLAGPFFTPHELWSINETRQCLEEQGLEVFSPFHEVGLGPAEIVARRDLDAIEKCNLVFALVDGYDPGTLFEIGYARALTKPVVVFCSSEESKHLTMLIGSGCEVHHNFVAAIYAAAWSQ